MFEVNFNIYLFLVYTKYKKCKQSVWFLVVFNDCGKCSCSLTNKLSERRHVMGLSESQRYNDKVSREIANREYTYDLENTLRESRNKRYSAEAERDELLRENSLLKRAVARSKYRTEIEGLVAKIRKEDEKRDRNKPFSGL
ncbi:TPA: hypothetical protein DCL22_01665 [Candidatus Moranbacteria bacterium]|nr:hypothetical protein [Candidatus Moranbacteria bacterium]